MRYLLTFFIFSLLPFRLNAQALNNDPTLHTIGRTINAKGRLHDFIIWQPGDATATFGARFAIYRKDGPADSQNPYTLLSEQTLQSAPSAILPLLRLGESFDFDADRLPRRIATIHAEALSQPVPDPLPTELTQQSAKDLSELLLVAAEKPETLETLFFVGRAHPGVMLALGHAFEIPAQPGKIHTYEIRQDSGPTNRVVGRVTLDTSNPTPITAPGAPVPVPHAVAANSPFPVSPKDNLVVRIRWRNQTPSRVEAPHILGYNIYRVKENIAKALGWDTTPPTANDMETLVQASLADSSQATDPDAARANTMPILPNKVIDINQAADPSDHETFFFADDIKARPAGQDSVPFSDGDTYYYYVAARDIAGHPGPLSPGTRIVICSRMAPPAPVILGVDNTFITPNNAAARAQLKGQQRLRLRIQRLKNDTNYGYYIYRWNRAAESLENGGNPDTNLVDYVTGAGDEAVIEWIDDDDSTGAPSIQSGDDAMADKVVWYTVRAEDNSACAPRNLSLHSPAVSGVLHDRADPGSPTGSFDVCRTDPKVEYTGITTNQPPIIGLKNGFFAKVKRLNKKITGFQMEVHSTDKNGIAPMVIRREFRLSDELTVSIPTSISEANITVTGYTADTRKDTITELIQIPAAIATSRVTFEIDAIRSCKPISTYDESAPGYDIRDLDGRFAGVHGTLVLPPDTWEYRIYRRVGSDAPLEMIDQGSGPEIPANVNWADKAPATANGTHVCFFGQVLDQNGNAGPLVRLGCTTVINEDIGTPILAAPESLPAPDEDTARIHLKWFCDPVGIERFVIWFASKTGEIGQLDGSNLSASIGDASNLGVPQPHDKLVFTPFQTASVTGSFGSGPEFEITFNLAASSDLTFVIQAVGPGTADDRVSGPFSNVVSSNWTPPEEAGPGNLIPWPQRGLPAIQDIKYDVEEYTSEEGPPYAMMTPGTWTNPLLGRAAILVGAYKIYTDKGDTPPPAQPELRTSAVRRPEQWFFKIPRHQHMNIIGDSDNSIFPFAVYRYQLPSEFYPNAVPNLTQVSPMFDRIAYKTVKYNQQVVAYDVKDPFFVFTSIENSPDVPLEGLFGRNESPVMGDPAGQTQPPVWLDGKDGLIYWVDHSPLTFASKYQYLIVCFTESGEVDRIIPTNPVTISNP